MPYVAVPTVLIEFQDPGVESPFSFVQHYDTCTGSQIAISLSSAVLAKCQADIVQTSDIVVVVMVTYKYPHDIFAALHGGKEIRPDPGGCGIELPLDSHRGALSGYFIEFRERDMEKGQCRNGGSSVLTCIGGTLFFVPFYLAIINPGEGARLIFQRIGSFRNIQNITESGCF